MTRICLNMIVKNEAPVIARCLTSVKPWIDRWAIVDASSSDGTQALVREVMGDLPGILHERPWIDCAHNRNEALALGRRAARIPSAGDELTVSAHDIGALAQGKAALKRLLDEVRLPSTENTRIESNRPYYGLQPSSPGRP